METVGSEPDLSNMICEYVVYKGKHIIITTPQKFNALRKKYGVAFTKTTRGY